MAIKPISVRSVLSRDARELAGYHTQVPAVGASQGVGGAPLSLGGRVGMLRGSATATD